jgi:uncharacterized protein (DUF983 family)
LAALNFFERHAGVKEQKADSAGPMKISAVRAGFAAKCPQCGQGPLFRGFLDLREACDRCGLDYRFIDTGDGPAVFGIFILGFLGLGGALIATLGYDVPQWMALGAVIVILPVVALGLLRFLKGTLIGLQYKYKAEEGRLSEE